MGTTSERGSDGDWLLKALLLIAFLWFLGCIRCPGQPPTPASSHATRSH